MTRKRITAVLILTAAAALLFGAAGAESDAYRIGISKIAPHPALDAMEQGIIDVLEEEGIKASFDLQNANGDISAAASIAQKFRADKLDLAVGIATPTAQALANAITDFPVVYAAVTDPVDAGLVSSYDRGEGNVTGVSDLSPVEDQIRLLAEITGARTIGHVYTSGEANAVLLKELTEEACRTLGLNFVATAVSNSSEVKPAVQAILDRVDGIYVSTDNTVISAIASIADAATTANVPILSADPTSAEGLDVLIAWGFNYYRMGRRTGYLVKEILEGADPADIGTVFMTEQEDFELWINLDTAAKIGLKLSDQLVSTASVIIENGVKTER